jgi:hypothetical protein
MTTIHTLRLLLAMTFGGLVGAIWAQVDLGRNWTGLAIVAALVLAAYVLACVSEADQ